VRGARREGKHLIIIIKIIKGGEEKGR